jgi:anti-sigma regulatory factor (Ser/Thr protein kinase)
MGHFHHEALFYEGRREFLAAVLPFLRDAVACSDPVLVVVEPAKIDLIRAALGASAGGVEFAETSAVARNPACLIPVWQEFHEQHAGSERRVRGVGEHVAPRLGHDQTLECHRHEALLNLAFEGGPPWWLLCPYDIGALGPAVMARATRSHPWIRRGGITRRSREFAVAALIDEVATAPLCLPTCDVRQRSFDVSTLRHVRELVREHAEPVLGHDRTADLVLAVSEIATNSVLHGGGSGVARVWHDRSGIVCEVSDVGRIAPPLAGRVRPTPNQPHGRGLWIVNQLCDLVQVRSFAGGSTVRVQMSRCAA